MQQTRGLNLIHNHHLKAIFKVAATTVLMQHQSDPLYADYQRLLAGGTKPNLAKVTLARKIAAVVLAVRKKEEAYAPEQFQKTAIGITRRDRRLSGKQFVTDIRAAFTFLAAMHSAPVQSVIEKLAASPLDFAMWPSRKYLPMRVP